MIDIGANLINGQFREDLDAVLGRARAAGVQQMLVTATSLAETEAVIALCKRHADLACTAGVHPHQAGETLAAHPDWLDALGDLARSEPVRAIGETGLDFYRNFSPRDAQLSVFEGQIKLAERLQLPLFVHDRDTDGAVHCTLKPFAPRLPGVVIHCFTGVQTDLGSYLDLGFFIGVTGWICDRRRGGGLRELIRQIPLERLLIETDAPFLLPHGSASPSQHKRRNEPCLLAFIAGYIADLLKIPEAELRARTAENARRLFNLPHPAGP